MTPAIEALLAEAEALIASSWEHIRESIKLLREGTVTAALLAVAPPPSVSSLGDDGRL